MTDSVANNSKFINLLINWAVEQGHDISFNKTDNYFHCFAHIINLSVQKALYILESKFKQIYIISLYLYFYIIN